MNRGRIIGIVLCLASIIGLVVSIPAMADRLSHRTTSVVWFHDPIPSPEFEFLGQPASLVTIDPPKDAAGGDRTRMEVHWRGEVHGFEIEEGTRDDPRLPGLLRHDDWLRILVMAEGAKSSEELDKGIADGTIDPRLIIAMRLPAKDYDPGSWGSVRRREWRYRFLELLPESRSPGKAFEMFEGTYGDLDKLGDPTFLRASGRQSEAWKHAAMQHVTPPVLYRSKSRSVEDAMASMGWTWPVAGLSVMGLVVGTVLLAVSGASRGA